MNARLVVCEGKHDQAVIEAVLEHLHLADRFSVLELKSRDNLRPFLRTLPKLPEFSRGEIVAVGVILDANGDPNAGWQRIVGAIEEVFQVRLPAQGIRHGERPSVAGLLMPTGGQSGMLEDVCLASVNDRPEFTCLEQYVQCVERVRGAKLHSKAKFRAWAASQPDPGIPVERAARNNLFPWDHEAFRPLRSFLDALNA